ncbi:MAG: ATP-binding protein, partial [Mariprofundales bacterium]
TLVDQYLHGGDEKSLGKIEKLGKAMIKADVPIERVAKFQHAAIKFLTHQRSIDQRIACASVLPLTHLMTSYAEEYRAKRKRKRNAMALRLEMASLAVANIKEGVLITDAKGTIIDVNPAFCRITGYSRKEAIGNNPRMLKSKRQDEFFYKEMWAIIREKHHWEGRVWNQRKNGEHYSEYLTIDAIYDKSGNMQNLIGAFSDIGEQVELEAQLHQAQKMEVVGTLVNGIAHNFNNAICGIKGNIYLAKREQDRPEQMQQRLQVMDDLCEHAADIVAQLLSFSRKTETTDRVALAVVPLIETTAKLARIGIMESTRFNIDYADPDLMIDADISLFQQMLFNLINNARDAVAKSHKPFIRIKVDSIHKDQALMDRSVDARLIDYCHISIADNGSGIDDDHLKRIFDPFFTTKGVGKGTGLGLSSVYSTVKSHHGVIEVESTLGKGTCFHIYLPIANAQADQRPNMISIHQQLTEDGPPVLKIVNS